MSSKQISDMKSLKKAAQEACNIGKYDEERNVVIVSVEAMETLQTALDTLNDRITKVRKS